MLGRDGEQDDVYDAQQVARVDDEDQLPRGHLVARFQRQRERHGDEEEDPDGFVPVRVIIGPLRTLSCIVIQCCREISRQ